MITLKAFGDESADGTKSLVFAVAAVIGSEDEWLLAIREWLRRTRGLPFHATDCESEFADHADREKHKANLKLYRDLTQILVESHLVGFAVALNLKSYDEVFPQMPHDWAYFKALADVIGNAASTARNFNGREDEPEDVRLEFVFDSRLESNGAAGTMYTMLARRPEWAATGIFATKIAFESGPGKSPRLEMGDLLARESMKELERKITGTRPLARRSRTALDETAKFVFIELDRDYWEKLKAYVGKPESAALMAEWDQWLMQRNMIQAGKPARNMANWFLFNAWLDGRDGLA